jgi:hydrogenase-4 component B
MRFGMATAAMLAALLGLGAGGALALLKPALEQWAGTGSSQGVSPWWSLPGANLSNSGATQTEGLNLLFLLLPLGLALAGWGVARLLGGRSRRTADETWACGITLKPSMEYNSISFIKPLRRVFQFVLLPFRTIKVTYRIEPYFMESIEYQSGIKSLLNSETVRLLRRVLSYLTTQVKVIQNGSIRLYLTYILVTLLLLLVFTR